MIFFLAGASDVAEIKKSMDDWERYTCLTFKQKTRSDKNYIHFVDGDG